MKTRREALELVVAAFLHAQRKLGPEATTMTIGVLKNRLLQITDRRFDPTDFGVADMRAFLAMLAPEVVVAKMSTHGEARLMVVPAAVHTASLSQIEPRQVDTPPKTVAPVETPQDILQAGGRTRPDLWFAVMDYASGQPYVWDERLGEARPMLGQEAMPVMPTVTPVELGEWRRTFIADNKTTLEGSEL